MLTLWRGLETIPVLMRAGAIIPMKDMTKYDNLVENPEEMLVYIFPAASGIAFKAVVGIIIYKTLI